MKAKKDELLHEFNIIKMEELNWKQIDHMDRSKTIVFLPISPLEEHGPHLPVGTDFLTAKDVSVNAIKILQKKKPELHFILHPIIPLGYCEFNIDFPGSISISPKTIREIIFGVGSSLARHNFHNLLICTFHMAIGHLKGIHQGMQKLRRKYDLRISEPWSTFFYSNQIEKREPKLGFDTSKELHAGFRETSLMKYQYPYLVDESHKKLQNIYRDLRSPSVLGKKFKELGLTEGYVGSPARSDADYGRWYFNETVSVLVNAAIDLYEGNPLPALPPSIRILMRSPIW